MRKRVHLLKPWSMHRLQAEVTAFQEDCSKDLAAAEPIIKEAEAALNSLDKASLGELKSFGSPAAEVVAVVSACMTLTAPNGKIPKVRFPQIVALPGFGTWSHVVQTHTSEHWTRHLKCSALSTAQLWPGLLAHVATHNNQFATAWVLMHRM